MRLLSKNNQTLRRFMQMFVLAPEGSVANKFYVHNDIFRYQNEVIDDFVNEPQEESEEKVEESEERQQTPEVVPDDSGTFYDQTVNNDLEEQLEKPVAEPEPDSEPEPEQEPEQEPVSEIQEEKSELALEKIPRLESKPESRIPPQRRQRDQRRRSIPIHEAGEQGDVEPQRIVRHPDGHQLFIGNLPDEVDKLELKDFFQLYGNMVELHINRAERERWARRPRIGGSLRRACLRRRAASQLGFPGLRSCRSPGPN
uniref:NTF2 domain-containing protein n=1 Tax=Neovison vison TaxID=452646 RepID=A0A8C7ABV7_NEOVI